MISETQKWAHRLFQTAGITDMSPTTPQGYQNEGAGMDLPTFGPSSSVEGISANPSAQASGIARNGYDGQNEYPSDNDKEEDRSNLEVQSASYNGSDGGVVHAAISKPASRVPTGVPVSVSRLAFPFNITSSPPRRKPSSPTFSSPPPRKVPSLPSPLGSEAGTLRKRTDSPHLNSRRRPRHHGYSRQALLYMKCFWSGREKRCHSPSSDNAEHQCAAETPGSNVPRATISDPNCPNGTCTFPYQQEQLPVSTAPPLTIYPRRGDINALRDPYCVQIDRSFAGFATWTIGKVLWMHDLYFLLARKSVEPETSPVDDDDDGFDESASEISFDTSGSIGFSDDSESTLVDSENEWEPPSRSSDYDDDDVKGDIMFTGDRTFNGGGSAEMVASRFTWTQSIYLKAPAGLGASCVDTLPHNWYRRWQLLLNLSRREREAECSRMDLRCQQVKVQPQPKHDVLDHRPKLSLLAKGFLPGLRCKVPKAAEHASSLVIQPSFLNPSHPAAG